MTATSALNVIILDDQGPIRVLVRRILQDLGIKRVHCTASPVEALSLARSGRIQLIISDYNMPEMDGLELLAAIRDYKSTNNPAYIILSGSGESDVVKKAVDLGANAYLTKPFRTIDLKNKIEQIFHDPN
jgi:two-component system chemotaxis response regulator CheY